MTVDKFGHYFDRKYNSEEKTKNLLKNFGFRIDDNNVNIEHKRIINVALPIEELDVANKAYVNSQISSMVFGLSQQVNNLKKEITDLNHKIDILLQSEYIVKTL